MEAQEYQELIKKKYPQLNGLSFEQNQQGWSNFVLEVGEKLIFRFPRDEESKRRLKIERQFLEIFKKRSSVSVPNFVFFSLEEEPIFVGYSKIQGKFLTEEMKNSYSKEERGQLAGQIACFLDSLHKIEEEQIDEMLDKWQEEKWDNLKEEFYRQARGYFEKESWNRIEVWFEELKKVTKNPTISYGCIHGDFTEDHILVEPLGNRLQGVIDFGDVEWGDPAYDFAGIWLSYGEQFCMEVAEQYSGNMDSQFFSRIKDYYLKKVWIHMLLYNISQNNEDEVRSILSEWDTLFFG